MDLSPPMQPPAPFSFHCTICFEVFHHERRYPVVLPCGHTFICHICSKRLKRCMECRTSLFFPLPQPTVDRAGAAAAAVGRQIARNRRARSRAHAAAAQEGNVRTPQRVEEIPLPLPRNVLLLSLMESAQREATAKVTENGIHKECASVNEVSLGEAEKAATTTTHSCGDQEECNALDEQWLQDGNEDDLVRLGINIINSSSGTYAVADPDGVPLHGQKKVEANVIGQVGSEVDEDNGFKHPHVEEIKQKSELATTLNSVDEPVHEDRFQNEESTKFAHRRDSSITPLHDGTVYNSEADSILARGCGAIDLSGAATSPLMETECEHSSSSSEVVHQFPAKNSQLLEFGSRMQVACIEDDGWVRLARGKGFLFVPPGSTKIVKGKIDYATRHALTVSILLQKIDHDSLAPFAVLLTQTVGPPQDRSCQIEGMLHLLGERKRSIIDSRNQIARIEVQLDKALQKSLSDSSACIIERKRCNELLQEAAKTNQSRSVELMFSTMPPSENRHDLRPHELRKSSAMRRSMITNQSSPGSAPDLLVSRSFDTALASTYSTNRGRPSPAQKRIDFRTGLSGHSALLSSTANAPQNVHRSVMRMMSHHMGLGGSSSSHQQNSSSGGGVLNCSQPQLRTVRDVAMPCSRPILSSIDDSITAASVTANDDLLEN